MALRVLIVDDDPLVLRAAELALAGQDLQVFAAKSRLDAVAVVRGGAPDVAVVDHDLAGESGVDLLAELRERWPHCARVLWTETTDPELLIDAVNRGEIARVLRRPSDPEALLALVLGAAHATRTRDRDATTRLIEGAMVERRAVEDVVRRRLFTLAVQPIVQVDGDRASVLAYEALLRPSHPEFRHAGELLDAAERTGKLDELGRAVMARAADWLKRLPEPLLLFVNVHPAQLGDLEVLAAACAPLVPSARRVVFEITESAPTQAISGWGEAVGWLQARGFGLAVDDLGAGYNSLTILAELAPQFVKIDMDLVRGVDADARKQRLVHLLATFADATGSRTIAEGVETAAEAATLQQLGVRLLQGHRYGRPAEKLLSEE